MTMFPRFIFDLDHVKLSLEIFFIMSLNGKLITTAFRIYLFFVKNTHQKASNLALQLILDAGMGYIDSFEV